MGSAQWLADYRDRVERVARDARTAGERLRAVDATATSPRGEVTVRVTAAGVLDHLTLTPAARRLEVDVLAGLIIDTVRVARGLATARTAEVLADLGVVAVPR